MNDGMSVWKYRPMLLMHHQQPLGWSKKLTTKLEKPHLMKSIFVALVVFLVCIGCSKSNSSPSIVGEWHGETKDGTMVLTILSDGTGDVQSPVESPKFKWKRVKDKFELIFSIEGENRFTATLGENNTLAVKNHYERTVVVLRK